MAPTVIETEATTVKLDDGILMIRSKGVFSTQNSIESTLDAASRIMGPNRHPLLFDAREWPGGDPEGWVTVISRIGTLFSAAAMLVDARASAGVGPFPQTIDRLVIPFMTFTDYTEAVTFLDTFRSAG